MASFLSAIADYVVYISYLHPQTNQMRTNVQCYASTPEPEYYKILDGEVYYEKDVLYKPMQINFIEM